MLRVHSRIKIGFVVGCSLVIFFFIHGVQLAAHGRVQEGLTYIVDTALAVLVYLFVTGTRALWSRLDQQQSTRGTKVLVGTGLASLGAVLLTVFKMLSNVLLT